MNPACFTEETITSVTEAFQARKPFDTKYASVLAKAYPLAVFKNFLDEDFAQKLKEAVLELPFKHKATDLFDINQSPDLRPFVGDGSDNPISQFSDIIFSPDFAGTIGKIIGKPLGTQIDLAAQQYTRGQYLLCHDDRLESRRVAFVLYLVDEEWNAQLDGGQFEKFPLDFTGTAMPEPVESYTPAWNTLVFFEVSMWSHHQVAEVLGSRTRLSVAGWLHDAPSEVSSIRLPESNQFIQLSTASPDTVREELIQTGTSKFTRLVPADDDEFILKIIKPETINLPGNLDYPTWPIILRVKSSDYFAESQQQASDKRIYCVHVIDGEAEVNGHSIELGTVLVHHDPHHTINALSESTTVICWSFLV